MKQHTLSIIFNLVFTPIINHDIPFPHTVAGAPKDADITLTVLNLLNKQYNGYEYISSKSLIRFILILTYCCI